MGKKIHVCLHILCAHAQFREKLISFMGCVKKMKKVHKKAYFSIDFCLNFFIGYTKSHFFLKDFVGM
jgi:hypothetical protein